MKIGLNTNPWLDQYAALVAPLLFGAS